MHRLQVKDGNFTVWPVLQDLVAFIREQRQAGTACLDWVRAANLGSLYPILTCHPELKSCVSLFYRSRRFVWMESSSMPFMVAW